MESRDTTLSTQSTTAEAHSIKTSYGDHHDNYYIYYKIMNKIQIMSFTEKTDICKHECW